MPENPYQPPKAEREPPRRKPLTLLEKIGLWGGILMLLAYFYIRAMGWLTHGTW